MTSRKERIWQEMQRRIDQIDWEPPVSDEEIENLHRALPKRKENESIADWLRNGFKTAFYTFSEISQIHLLAAAGGDIEPEVTFQDQGENFLFIIRHDEAHIYVKVETLPHAIDMYANCKLGITYAAAEQETMVLIGLDNGGHGEIELDNSPEYRELFLESGKSLSVGIMQHPR